MRSVRIIHVIKQKIAKHLKNIYNQRVNTYKEGQIGDSRFEFGRISHIGGSSFH